MVSEFYSDLTAVVLSKGISTDSYRDLIKRITGIEFGELHPLRNFYSAPASTKFHGSFKGGLALHGLTVYNCALKLASGFGFNSDDIDANACIFHDLVKTNLYIPGKFSGFEYDKTQITLPHGSESIRLMYKYNIPLKSEAWEFAVAYHMGAFEKDNMDMYSRACDKYKEVLLLHTADMMATKIYKH